MWSVLPTIQPHLRRCIEVFNDFGGITDKNAVRGTTLRDNRISAHDAVSTQDQVTLCAKYHTAITQPAVPFYQNLSSRSYSLGSYGGIDVGVFVIMVGDEHCRSHKDILLKPNTISCGYY
jgi:hypothetical protein